MKKAKAIIIVLIIVLISLISFIGVYNVKSVIKTNLLPEYLLGMDFDAKIITTLKVDDTVNSVTYDAEGNVVEDTSTLEESDMEAYTTENVPVNKPESLTTENYKIAKEIIEKRLKGLTGVNGLDGIIIREYTLSQNEQNGTIEVKHTKDVDIAAVLFAEGKFEITDEETGEVLLNNSNVKSAKVDSTVDSLTGVQQFYLTIDFNKEGKEKLKEISNKYVQSTVQTTPEPSVNPETGETIAAEPKTETVAKNVLIKLDDTTLETKYFSETIKNGKLQVLIQSVSDPSNYIVYALQIDSGKLPIVYTGSNIYVGTPVSEDFIAACLYTAIGVFAVLSLVLVFKFRLKGLVAIVLQVGYLSLLLLALRYVNAYITISAILAIVFANILNYTFLFRVLAKANKENLSTKQAMDAEMLDLIKTYVPVLIAIIVLCFAKWLEISSFGIASIWGIMIFVIYNLLFSRNIYSK
ncbi:MAG: hypothetical protein LBL91_02705 [Lachnospiraceae bacterium]|jgi:preprotein translocase subunit SecD|nr:hypothetical protein [Lachnospiraceae bacterium]